MAAKKKATTQSAPRNSSKGFTSDEKAAMKERALELKAEAEKADGESALLAAVAKMPPADRGMAKRIHSLIKTSAPGLAPKTWYGMPAWARDGKVLCFFQSADKFKARYATFGFSDEARLDDGEMWPTSYALKELTAGDEARLLALVKKAVG
jgi:uncharacterized protein YdhG (YjbR/CyaY superfamily)